MIFFLSVLYQTTIVSVTVNCDGVCFILYILHVTHFVRILFQFNISYQVWSHRGRDCKFQNLNSVWVWIVDVSFSGSAL